MKKEKIKVDEAINLYSFLSAIDETLKDDDKFKRYKVSFLRPDDGKNFEQGFLEFDDLLCPFSYYTDRRLVKSYVSLDDDFVIKCQKVKVPSRDDVLMVTKTDDKDKMTSLLVKTNDKDYKLTSLKNDKEININDILSLFLKIKNINLDFLNRLEEIGYSTNIARRIIEEVSLDVTESKSETVVTSNSHVVSYVRGLIDVKSKVVIKTKDDEVTIEDVDEDCPLVD